MTTIIRAMTVEDYDQLHALWMRIKGFDIRSLGPSDRIPERIADIILGKCDQCDLVDMFLFQNRMFLSCMCRSGVPLSC